MISLVPDLCIHFTFNGRPSRMISLFQNSKFSPYHTSDDDQKLIDSVTEERKKGSRALVPAFIPSRRV